MTRTRCMRPSTPPTRPRASRRYCWSRPSRATAWARLARARTPRTRPRSSSDDDIRVFPRPLQHPDPDDSAVRDAVLQAGRRYARDALHARAAQGAGRLPAQRRGQGRRAVHGAAAGDLQGGASTPPPRAARSQHHAGLSCACSPRCCATSRSARASCPSWSTRRAPSAWRACSARSASTTRRGRSTRRSTRTRSCTTRKTRPDRSCRKASTRPAA
jgi:hypothetical protein